MRSRLHVFVSAGVWLLVILFLVSGLSGQQGAGNMTGKVSDPSQGVLQGARIELQPGGQSTQSDASGEFSIKDLSAGRYTVTVSHEGFGLYTTDVTVMANSSARVDAILRVGTHNEVVTVTGERQGGELEALTIERTADNIVQVLPADVITSLPNTNIADAVGRLPSVSLERDEGEGKYVQIRGTEPRLSNVTIDGVHLPSPEPVRNVKLDAIPADLVDSVEVNKTLSADQEGDAIGGSVNLVTKKATDQPYVTLLAMGGHTPIEGGRNLNQFAGTVGKRFGREKRFGVMVGGSYDWNGRGTDDVEPVPGLTSVANGDFADGVPVFFGEDIRQFWYDRTRFGFGASADYKLGAGAFLYVRGLFSEFKDGGQNWIYTPNVSNYTSATTTAPTNMVFNHVFRNPFQQIFNVTVGAQHTLGCNIIGYEVSGAQARSSGALPRAVFNSPGGIVFGLDTKDPFTPKFNVLNGVNIFDPTMYPLSQVQYNSKPTSEQDFTGNIWLTHQYKIGTHFGTLETGFKVRDAQKKQKDTELYFNCDSCAKMSQFLQSFVNSDYYLGAYQIGPTTDWNKINSFYLANSSTLFTPDSNRSHRAGDSNNFSLSERVYAGYVMNTITIGRVRLQTGLRFEGTQGSFLGTQANFDPNGNFLFDSRVPGAQSYLDVLPSAQLQYNINGSTNIRAAYGRGIARPNFGDLPPFATLDQGGIGGTTRVFTGNPDLKPTHANDFDLLFEHYLKSVGIIQVGWFYKDLTDPIYTVQSTPTSWPFTGFRVTQKINGPGGHITGIEMNWQQHLRSLPGLLGGIGVSANYIYTTSQASFPATFGRTDHPHLLRQAPNNWNFDVTYDKGPISARMGLSHNDANIFAYNFSDGPAGGQRGQNGDVLS